MKRSLLLLAGIILVLPCMTSCAAGAATAAYALKAKEADCLSAAGEERVTERVKREIQMEYFEGKGSSHY
jgi:hypothetical protein